MCCVGLFEMLQTLFLFLLFSLTAGKHIVHVQHNCGAWNSYVAISAFHDVVENFSRVVEQYFACSYYCEIILPWDPT